MAKDYRNTLTVTGPKADRDRLIAAHLRSRPGPGKETTLTFDFASIVPVPADLSDLGASSVDTEGYDLYFGDEGPSERARQALAFLLSKGGDLPIEEFRETLKSEAPQIFERARQLQDNIRRFGVQNAWEWKIRHWGSPEAFDTRLDPEDEEATISFITEESPPIPLFKALSTLYPTLGFDLEYFEPVDMIEGHLSAAKGTIREETP